MKQENKTNICIQFGELFQKMEILPEDFYVVYKCGGESFQTAVEVVYLAEYLRKELKISREQANKIISELVWDYLDDQTISLLERTYNEVRKEKTRDMANLPCQVKEVSI